MGKHESTEQNEAVRIKCESAVTHECMYLGPVHMGPVHTAVFDCMQDQTKNQIAPGR